ncbi:hypothetical protein CRENBAI_013577 [Crenichthys baileyi]|uniref:Uncharacterized protein n=1 Tax=Crenichthys baileyi TaxID=28760 RepID=A0AAV9S583_9TELE
MLLQKLEDGLQTAFCSSPAATVPAGDRVVLHSVLDLTAALETQWNSFGLSAASLLSADFRGEVGMSCPVLLREVVHKFTVMFS